MTKQHWLFAYGPLRQPDAQNRLFGRELPAVEDALPGFRIERLPITDAAAIARSGSDCHPVLRRGGAGEEVRGLALAVSDGDLSQADIHEISDYVRTVVTLASGRTAFAYMHLHDAMPPRAA